MRSSARKQAGRTPGDLTEPGSIFGRCPTKSPPCPSSGTAWVDSTPSESARSSGSFTQAKWTSCHRIPRAWLRAACVHRLRARAPRRLLLQARLLPELPRSAHDRHRPARLPRRCHPLPRLWWADEVAPGRHRARRHSWSPGSARPRSAGAAESDANQRTPPAALAAVRVPKLTGLHAASSGPAAPSLRQLRQRSPLGSRANARKALGSLQTRRARSLRPPFSPSLNGFPSLSSLGTCRGYDLKRTYDERLGQDRPLACGLP